MSTMKLRVFSPSVMRALIKQYHGDRGQIAAAVGISKNTLRRVLVDLDLLPFAHAESYKARRSGNRSEVPDAVLSAELLSLQRALAKGTAKSAARELGMSPATLYRRRAFYGI